MIAHMTAKPTEHDLGIDPPTIRQGIADITGEVPHFFSIHRGGCVV